MNTACRPMLCVGEKASLTEARRPTLRIGGEADIVGGQAQSVSLSDSPVAAPLRRQPPRPTASSPTRSVGRHVISGRSV